MNVSYIYVCLHITIPMSYTVPMLDGFELALEERYRRTLLEIDSLKEDLGESFIYNNFTL